MQIGRVHDPRDERDRLLGVPAPVPPPGLLSPDRAEDHAEPEHREREDRCPVGDPVQCLRIRQLGHDAAGEIGASGLPQPGHLHQEQDAGHTRDQEHPRTQADHRDVDRQPVRLQRRHHRRRVRVEPLAGHRQQDQHRHQYEHPQRAVLRPTQDHRGGDQTAETGQVDELVHVAPRHP